MILPSSGRTRTSAHITAEHNADFVCHETRLIVKIDGGQHDRSSPTEAARTEFLQNEGYRLLRFWNNGVFANFDGVQQMIADQLGRVTPTRPSPIKGEGSLLGDQHLPSHDV